MAVSNWAAKNIAGAHYLVGCTATRPGSFDGRLSCKKMITKSVRGFWPKVPLILKESNYIRGYIIFIGGLWLLSMLFFGNKQVAEVYCKKSNMRLENQSIDYLVYISNDG